MAVPGLGSGEPPGDELPRVTPATSWPCGARWPRILLLIRRSRVEHSGYWLLVSWGLIPEEMGQHARQSMLP